MLLAGTAPMVLPSRLLGENAPSRTLNLACIGIGQQGRNISRSFGNIDRVNMVAVCDIDMNGESVQESLNAFPNARRFEDFRRMLEEMGDDIDAVAVNTPDHAHFCMAILAMSMGKHVFVEKPMANTFREAELLMAAEKKYGVVTQMGNQGHSGPNYHQFKAYSEAGLLDGMNKVVAYMNSGRRWHPWGDVQGFPEGEPVPEGLRWDLWHTVIEERPFSSRFHPGNWRGWYRYGMGALGDWAPHLFDTVHRFLHLGLPERIDPVHIRRHNPYIFPLETTLKFDFPARGDKPPVELYWYDGTDNIPEKPEELGDGSLGANGSLMYGGKHTFMRGSHGAAMRVLPDSLRREVQPGLPGFSTGSSHYENFVLSAMGEESTRSPFEVAGPLNQVLNLGIIAQELNTPLEFDREAKRFTNNDTANELLAGPPPREDWEQYYRL